ncbi:MAG: hypothetical protein KIS76_16200 [Pyrinomonadaceae bacterium]|nr:hypothetical protein [Pyrinomonadaceae bacterium]
MLVKYSRVKLGIGLGVFVLLVSFVALITNHYYYSWSSNLTLFGCAYKYIGLKPGSERLGELQDLDDLERKVRNDPNSKSRITYFGSEQLATATIIGDIQYSLRFQNTRAGGKQFTKVSLSASGTTDPSNAGESSNHIDSRVPDHVIDRGLISVLDQLPFTEFTRKELKHNTVIICHPTSRIGF